MSLIIRIAERELDQTISTARITKCRLEGKTRNACGVYKSSTTSSSDGRRQHHHQLFYAVLLVVLDADRWAFPNITWSLRLAGMFSGHLPPWKT